MKLRTKVGLGMLIFGALIGIFLVIQVLASSKKYIPQEFIEAKVRGAEIAQKIVDLSSESLNGLNQISDYDKAKDYPEAVILVSNEINHNRETRAEAVRLASQLEKMAASLSKIKPAKARQIAAEAISYEVALVSRLISYNDYFNQLFDILIKKFKNATSSANDKVQELINEINDETRAINELNARFNNTITEFDEIFR